MLDDYRLKQLDELRKAQMAFIHEIACKYGMTYSEVMRLCCYLHIEPAHMNAHTLESSHVQH